MAIWETPTVLSGEVPATTGTKVDLGLCMCHQMWVTMEWAMRLRALQIPPHVYFLNRNQPYDVAREQMTRACLEKDVKYIFHLDTDCILKDHQTIPKLIQIIEEKKLDIVCILYWAKKRELNCPCAWKQLSREGTAIKYAPIQIDEHIAKGDIVQVDVAGAGGMMVKADVFRKLEKNKPGEPFFVWGLGRKGLPQISEDFYFFNRCVEELGIHPYIATSLQADHVTVGFKDGKDGHYELMRV